jgi:hypothetical protein
MANVEIPEPITRRRADASARLHKLVLWLNDHNTRPILGTAACVYATGSMGRGEASSHSDLDLFIVAQKGRLSGLEAIKVKSRLIEATEELKFPPFSGDGEYLEVHVLSDLVDRLGSRQDDATNSFTARMLLLTESRPILGDSFYKQSIRAVVNAYWRDFGDHDTDFRPVFLINDILRYWKLLCLSYESHGAPQGNVEIAKRRLRNYKLKYSRLLICYSAIVYLCWLSRVRQSVTPADAMRMIALRPLERLENVRAKSRSADASDSVTRILELYSTFLDHTDAEKDVLIKRFGRQTYHEQRRNEAREFGDEIFRLLNAVALDLPIYRYLVV